MVVYKLKLLLMLKMIKQSKWTLVFYSPHTLSRVSITAYIWESNYFAKIPAHMASSIKYTNNGIYDNILKLAQCGALSSVICSSLFLGLPGPLRGQDWFTYFRCCDSWHIRNEEMSNILMKIVYIVCIENCNMNTPFHEIYSFQYICDCVVTLK